MKTLRNALVGLVLLATAAPAMAGQVVDRIVAVVNRDIILMSEVQQTWDMVASEALRGTPAAQRAQAEVQLRSDILEGLIANQLMEQAMESAGMEVTEADLEAAVADVARQNGMTAEQLYGELERQGMSLEEYRGELKKQLKQYKFMNLEIRGRVRISDEDVLNYYNQMTADVTPDPGWRLQMILLAYPATAEDADRARISDEADTLIAEVVGGKDFGVIAKARSDDPAGREAAGEAGVVKPNELSPLFSKKLAEVPVGTPVRVDTPGGIYLLRVAEEVDTARRPLDEVRDLIMRVLYDEAMERELEVWTAEQRRRAHVEVML